MSLLALAPASSSVHLGSFQTWASGSSCVQWWLWDTPQAVVVENTCEHLQLSTWLAHKEPLINSSCLLFQRKFLGPLPSTRCGESGWDRRLHLSPRHIPQGTPSMLHPCSLGSRRAGLRSFHHHEMQFTQGAEDRATRLGAQESFQEALTPSSPLGTLTGKAEVQERSLVSMLDTTTFSSAQIFLEGTHACTLPLLDRRNI